MAPCPPLKTIWAEVAILRLPMAPCPPLKTLWAAAAGCNSRDSEIDGWHPVHPQNPLGRGCNSKASETDGWRPKTNGWRPVHPSKPSGQPRQLAILGIPKLTDGTLSTPRAAAAGCNSRIPKLTDGTLSTPQNPLGSRGRLQF